MTKIPDDLAFFLLSLPTDGSKFEHGAIKAYRDTESDSVCITVGNWSYVLRAENGCVVDLACKELNEQHWHTYEQDAWRNELLIITAKLLSAMAVEETDHSAALLKFFLERFDLREYDGWYVLYDKVNDHPSDWLPANDDAQRNLIIDALLKLKGVTK